MAIRRAPLRTGTEEVLRRLSDVAEAWRPIASPVGPIVAGLGPKETILDTGLVESARPVGRRGTVGEADLGETVDSDAVESEADLGESAAGAEPRRLDVRGLRAVLVLVLAGVLVAGWWWWSGRPRDVAPAPTVIAAGLAVPGLPGGAAVGTRPGESGAAGEPGSPGPTAPSVATSAAPTRVVVHVVGEVRRPGVVRLPRGSRVMDAVTASGGVRPGGSLGPVNLARPLTDGEQIVVGPNAPPEPVAGATDTAGSAGSVAGTTGPLDLNSATLDQLVALPRVGPVMAQRIIDWRTEHGRFTSVAELREVAGIGEKTFADLGPRVRV